MTASYDAIGLLRPAHTGAENRYRYYDAAQLPILLQIENLKSFGFTLAQITETTYTALGFTVFRLPRQNKRIAFQINRKLEVTSKIQLSIFIRLRKK